MINHNLGKKDDKDKMRFVWSLFLLNKDKLEFKKESKGLLSFHMNTKGEKFKDIMLEDW